MRVRVSTSMMSEQSVTSMLQQQTYIAETQEKMALGLRVVRPSDDPPAAVRALILKESIEQNEQFQVNINMAKSRLEQSDGVLGGIVDTLQRMNDLAIQSLNAPLTLKERLAIEAEARKIISQITDLANSKTGTGEYLFAGLQSKTEPFTGRPQTGGYTYHGDDNLRFTPIGQNHTINDNDPGSKVFTVKAPLSGPPQTTLPPDNIMNLMYTFAEHLKNNVPDSYDLANIQLAIQTVSSVSVTVGSRLSALDLQKTLTDKLVVDEKTHLSQTQDLDYTEAITQLNVQTVALQAAQQA